LVSPRNLKKTLEDFFTSNKIVLSSSAPARLKKIDKKLEEKLEEKKRKRDENDGNQEEEKKIVSHSEIARELVY